MFKSETDSFFDLHKNISISLMNLVAAEVYKVRFGPKLSLPQSVQDNIARLRITPVAFKSLRPPPKFYGGRERISSRPSSLDQNWRNKIIAEFIRKVKEHDDPEYAEAFAILNKLAPSNLDKLTQELSDLVEKRDEQFRIRVVTLLFNKSIQEHLFAGIMADCIKRLSTKFPEIKDDILVQIELFPQLYNMSETIVFPSSELPDFRDKVVEWMQQKEKRRGYSKFMTYLFIRELVSEELMLSSLNSVVEELNLVARQQKTSQTEENTTQFVDFLFESAKSLPVGSNVLRQLLWKSIDDFLKVPRPELPSLCMRSRFKAEDTLKCVQ
jgi:hypothetical protein